MKKVIFTLGLLLLLTSCFPQNQTGETSGAIEKNTGANQQQEEMADVAEINDVDYTDAGMQKDAMKAMESNSQDTSGESMEKMGEMMKEDEDVVMNDTMDKGDTMMGDEKMMDDTMMKQGTYEEYSLEKLGKYPTTVLFFYAPWCPSCRAADEGIQKGSLPEGVAVLKVDYDSATDLKKKYGVTYQHTFVQVDAQGEMITKWSGGTTVQDILDAAQ